ncbi:IS66 family insertion sequence element accessory protein TnpA, partial [Lewinella cohaerens]|uniref:IS66 family insertion sequence element accessory protein TnpA n=2 Tax=Lewinella cohaerens TaxID=70995 RepID=UPI00035DDBBF
MSNTALRQRWDAILSEQSRSGLTKKAFCEQRGLNPATFYYWQRRLRASDDGSPAGFQRVILQEDHELTVC